MRRGQFVDLRSKQNKRGAKSPMPRMSTEQFMKEMERQNDEAFRKHQCPRCGGMKEELEQACNVCTAGLAAVARAGLDRLVRADKNKTPTRETGTMSSRKYVKMYRAGAEVALSTNIPEEAEFNAEFAMVFDEYIHAHIRERNGVSTDLMVAEWLSLYADVICKLRGYKAPLVDEQVVLLAGGPFVRESDVVGSSEIADADANGKPIRETVGAGT